MRIAFRSIQGNWTVYGDKNVNDVMDKYICSYQYLEDAGPMHKHFKLMRYSKYRNYMIYNEIPISDAQTFCKLKPGFNQQPPPDKKDA